MTNLTIYGQICFWDDYTVQVFLSVSKKEYYLLQQLTKSYEFKVMVDIITTNEATQCPPHHWHEFCLLKVPVQFYRNFQTIKNISLYNSSANHANSF